VIERRSNPRGRVVTLRAGGGEIRRCVVRGVVRIEADGGSVGVILGMAAIASRRQGRVIATGVATHIRAGSGRHGVRVG